jgi:diacylglycerol kinase family enzyme
VLVVLAGDGTARAAAELCGMDGPILAPLPGGTMNMLPHAVYGVRAWTDILPEILSTGAPRTVGGGEVDGRLFLVAAILGAPALWAPAREAVRQGRLRLAVLRARRALDRAFTGRLRYSLDGGPRGKAEAMAFLCPLASRALENDAPYLEAAALDPAGAGEAFRLGAQALIGDWRKDGAVAVSPCIEARVWAAAGVPGLLDGESVRLDRSTHVRFRPGVVRVLAPSQAPD